MGEKGGEKGVLETNPRAAAGFAVQILPAVHRSSEGKGRVGMALHSSLQELRARYLKHPAMEGPCVPAQLLQGGWAPYQEHDDAQELGVVSS